MEVKLFYKTLNELAILGVLITYSLLGQTYKAKNFDFVFYGAIAMMLMNNFRITFFFIFTDWVTLVSRTTEIA